MNWKTVLLVGAVAAFISAPTIAMSQEEVPMIQAPPPAPAPDPTVQIPHTNIDASLNTPPVENPGNRITISPGQVGPAPNPDATNPSQANPPQGKGVIVTIPLGGH